MRNDARSTDASKWIIYIMENDEWKASKNPTTFVIPDWHSRLRVSPGNIEENWGVPGLEREHIHKI